MFKWRNSLGENDPLRVPSPPRNQGIDIIPGMRDTVGGFIFNTR